MKLLRTPEFQDLLENYPRAPRQFLVAYETVDEVSSEWRVRDAAGNEHKPEDYLQAFARFVRDNPEHIQAIEILLDRPQQWSTKALRELRTKLASCPMRFNEDNLRRAHQIRYDKALADIISMVKHAADEHAPLLTAEERVDRALAQITAGHEFTEAQQTWLGRIRAHLIENLTIDHEDFDILPVFNREGGWAAANRIFQGQLDQLVHQLNEVIAA